MIIVPEDYRNLELSPIKKIILSLLKRKLSDEYTLFINLNPTGIQPIPFTIVSKNNGISCIFIDEIKLEENIDDYILLMKGAKWDRQEKILNNKLLREKTFQSENATLNVGLKWIYIFPNIKRSQLEKALPTTNMDVLFLEDFFSLTSQKVSFEKHLLNNSQLSILTDLSFKKLSYMLAPHYYIPVKVEKLQENNQASIIRKEDLKVKLSESVVDTLALDNDQVNIINKVNYGNHLLLACAGSGKSALLIAKAFQFASAYPDKKVLITCFNTNLAQYYQWRIDVAGISKKNVECRTFHSLCQHLLIENGLKIPLNITADTYFDDLFNLVLNEYNKDKIASEYDAIFIDEVQIFKKEWYKFCYRLLSSHKEDEHLFIISGDKSQNVNNNLEKGLAPWQINEKGYPKYNTNTIRIEKNYRNSKEINDYINNFVSITKSHLNDMNFEMKRTEDVFLRGQATRSGRSPEIIESNRTKETTEVFNIINKLQSNEVPLSEIAILIPQRKFSPAKYFILNWLKERFKDSPFDYTLLLNDDDAYERYGERKGVSICTIESALGLDFKAVIMCGLYPLGLYERSDRLVNLTSNKNKTDEMESRKEDFFKNINQLYTGMTRARDHLYIVLTQGKNNIYTDILLSSHSKGRIT